MTFVTQTGPDFERLRSRLCAPVVVAGEGGWDAARQAWNLAVDQQPAAVAYATSAEDVVTVVNFAREHELRVAAQGTGHGASTLALEDTILLKTLRMRVIAIDAGRRVARVQAGTLWGELAAAAGEHGLAGLAGTAADVGVVGYTLGGGLGWLGRRYGLACNSVRAVELVTAAGEWLRADRDHHPELFWALRGGGGGFGIVTALELDLYPVADVFGALLAWPAEDAADVLERFRTWTRTVPDTLSSIFRVLNAPPLPSVPEPLRGRAVVTVDIAHLGPAEEAERMVHALRANDAMLLDTSRMMRASQLAGLHGEPQQPSPGIGDGVVIDELSANAAQTFLELGSVRAGNPLAALELRHLGGQLAYSSPDHGALASLEGAFALYGVGVPVDEETGAAIHAHLDAVTRAMEPYTSARSYLNFADRQADPSDAFGRSTFERLRRVKSAYDPQDLVRSNHPVPPTR
jgi:FAD/FMN-containing dehydrogenase